MHPSELTLSLPPEFMDQLASGRLCDALDEIARVADASFHTTTLDEQASPVCSGKAHSGYSEDDHSAAVHLDGRLVGHVLVEPNNASITAQKAAAAAALTVGHALEREQAVDDLAEALMIGYDELNLLYSFLPTMATKVDPSAIGDALVAEAARTLACKRVSLLILDESHEHYKVLASRGLPDHVCSLSVPVSDSLAAKAVSEKDMMLVNNLSSYPDLASLSKGEYETDAFAVVRVPLTARGEALGVLTATDRIEGKEFTARDRKLLETLSSMGASALLNCQLHVAANKQMMSTIHALASAVDAKDQYTHDHAGRVAKLCVATACQLGDANAQTRREVELAGLLHDIGKIGIPDAILSKPSSLTPDEYRTMQAHVSIGAGIVRHVPGLERVAQAILHHHERYDGLGYPDGLSGEAIPRTSAIISVADTFDSLTSDRPYRAAGPAEDALREIERNKGTQLDPEVVDAFTTVIRKHLLNNQNGSGLLTLTPAMATPEPIT